jgi:hypothetical protein
LEISPSPPFFNAFSIFLTAKIWLGIDWSSNIKLQSGIKFFEGIGPQISISFKEVSVDIFVCGTK